MLIGASLSEPHIDEFAMEFVIHHAISHFRLLFCTFLRHLLTQKLFTNNSVRRRELSTSLMATERTGSTCGPTYQWPKQQWLPLAKRFCLSMPLFFFCHLQWKSLVTWTNLSNGHI